MFKKFIYNKSIKYFFYGFSLIYFLLLIINANFGIIDDHVLTKTLLINKNIELHIFKEIGRFFPLNAQEYNILSWFSVSPTAFYFFNAIQYLLIIYFVMKIAREIFGNKHDNLIYLSLFIMTLTPGFASAWVRLFVPERDVLFYLLAFLFFYIKFQNNQKNSYFIFSLILLNIALYYKEPAFVMVGTFAFLHLLIGWRDLNIKFKVLDVSILLSSLVFIIVYYLVVFVNIQGDTYGAREGSWLIIFIKNIINYIHSDPIVLVLIIFAVYRLFLVLYRKEKFDLLLDPMLFSSIVYFFVLLKLNIYAYHYTLPVYVFGIFSFLACILYMKKSIVKNSILVLFSFIFLVSSLPIAIHSIAFYKNTSAGYQQTLVFLRNYINSNHESNINLFLDGSNVGEQGEVYNSFASYLNYNGISLDQFDLKSDGDYKAYFGEFKAKKDSPFTVFRQNQKSKIETGDLLVITPYTYKNISDSYLRQLKQDFNLVFHYNPIINIPDVSIKALIKEFYIDNSNSNIVSSQNGFKSQNFYVFKKK